MSKVIVPNGKRTLPFQKGILISNTSLPELLKYVADRYDMKYLITGRILPDQLEHFFAAMRAKARNKEILDTRANVQVEPVPWLDIDISSMQSSSSSSVPANLATTDETENVAELDAELTDDSIEDI
ncbi:hypothetical protein ACLKA6_010452 [Drosophila palustris]